MVGRGLGRHAEALGQLEHGRLLEHGPVFEQRDGQAVLPHPGDRQQLAGLPVALDVEPPGRDAVAGQEVAQVVGALGEAVPDDPHAARLERRARLPRRQEVLDDGEELLLGRVPRLEQVEVQRDLVDGLDRRLGVGVGREQDALGRGHEAPGLDEVLRARHPGHALVGDEQRDLLAAADELTERLQALRARPGAHDAVALAELPAQVAGDGGQDRGLVVDGHDRRAAMTPRRSRRRARGGAGGHGLDATSPVQPARRVPPPHRGGPHPTSTRTLPTAPALDGVVGVGDVARAGSGAPGGGSGRPRRRPGRRPRPRSRTAAAGIV